LGAVLRFQPRRRLTADMHPEQVITFLNRYPGDPGVATLIPGRISNLTRRLGKFANGK